MGLHPEFPKSPYSELMPDQRWFPATEEFRSTAYEELLPPYYFAQREVVETVIWLHDVRQVRDKFDLFRFDAIVQKGYERNPPQTFASLVAGFTDYQES